MKLRNELKIGLTIVFAAIVFYLGTRFLRDLPIFGQATIYHTELVNSNGLVAGNIVAVNGVGVGSIREVQLRPSGVYISFSVNDDVVLTEGTTASAGGFGFVSSVQLNLSLGPSSAPIYQPGSLIPAAVQSDIIGDLVDRTPQVLNRVDSLLVGSSTAIGAATEMLTNPESQMKQTFSSIESSAKALQSVLVAEEGSIRAALKDVKNLSTAISTLATDSLGTVTTEIKNLLDQLSGNLELLETTTNELNHLISSINDGQGTLGMLVTDDSLYLEMQRTASTARKILEDFEQNPRKYLEHLRLIDIF
ncbi:MAG: hypothetical protein OXE92_07530 [Bacteroidetes bacterium]|nr:hypothetical protein [Bacteroidota bacterium]MCY4205556.1 hypothetical protein [Bacteroidota bacterium]